MTESTQFFGYPLVKIAYHRMNYLFYIETQENGALQVNSLKHFCTPLITKRMLHHKNTPRSLGILNDSFFSLTRQQYAWRTSEGFINVLVSQFMRKKLASIEEHYSFAK